MFYPLEIKPLIGLSDMLFDSSMAEVEKKIGKATEVQLIDDIIEFKTTVWHSDMICYRERDRDRDRDRDSKRDSKRYRNIVIYF